MTIFIAAAALALAAWVYLFLLHGRFWHADQRINVNQVNEMSLPGVVAVIPARNEAETIAGMVRSLLNQDYPAPFSIVVVDDDSDDATADLARSAAVTAAEQSRVRVVSGEPLPHGWTGKMWAVKQGIDVAPSSDYVLLTDADISHSPDLLSDLVAKAEGEGIRLVSLMVRLNCRSFWENLLIPAFVYYFQKLYPFPRVNDPNRREAAAAGGCMLVHRKTLEDAGGIAAIHDAVIDDCALAALMKPHGRVWLGLTETTESSRPYPSLHSIWKMVARTGYRQLNHNPTLLAGAVAGMILLYLVPPFALIVGALSANAVLVLFGASAWSIMVWTYLPTVGLYRLSPLWALSLPLAGVLFTLMTIDSARRHYARSNDQWKGRRYGA